MTTLILAFFILTGGVHGDAQAAGVKNVPICIDDICFTVPITPNYFVKVDDFNGDGKLDLYVTGHPTRRFVKDFLLYQNNPESYSINASPTQAEVARARGAPISPIVVSRMELNADRFYDFYLRDVDEVIVGATDIIVTLARGTGGTPTHVVPVTGEFEKLVDGFTGILTAADKWVEATQGAICQPPFVVGLPTAWDLLLRYPTATWEPYLSSVDALNMTLGSGSSGHYVSFSAFAQPVGPNCTPRILMLKPEYRSFVLNALTASKHTDISDGADIWSEPWCTRVFRRYSRDCPNRYLYQNGGLLLELAIGTGLIVAVLYYTGQLSSDQLRDLVDSIESAGNDGWIGSLPIPPNATDANRDDMGPGTRSAPATGVDKYAFQGNCDHGPNNVPPNRGTSVAGKGKTLGENLTNVGCGCPADSDPHHILPKADGEKFPAVLRARIRGCLDKAGIDVDHPANGVCLPRNKDPSSKAVQHGEANQKTYWNSVADHCERAYNANGPGGVRNMLDQARKNLLSGNRWWKPGGGPFYPEP